MKNPALPGASMMCAEEVGAELPSTIECDYDRGIAIEQTQAGLKVTLNPALARETYYFTAEGDKGKPGPTVYTLTRADPLATSYDPKLFDAGTRYIPNSSAETRHLPGKRGVKPADPERIALAVRRAGFDPATLWLDLVDSLRSTVESLPDYSEWSVMSKQEREAFIDKKVAEKVISEAPRVRTSTEAGTRSSSE